ncbi:fluoride efflux transporter FluC [Demequina aurantiaca]|uniref:fluoride efflux transporter FluC n=1 Tax=Demequina aurantiaca TaxID=676200 RepID=UPI003D3534F1
MSPAVFAAAALACGAGAVVRFLLTRINGTWKLPWPTLIANAAGSLVLGAIAQVALNEPDANTLMLIVGGGFAGGLTTFSSLAVDAVVLWRSGRPAYAGGYLGVTFVVGLAGAALGWAIASGL